MTTRVLFVGHSAALSGAELFLAGMLERVHDIEPVVLLFEDGPLVDRLRLAGIGTTVCPMPGAVGAVSQSGSGAGAAPRAVRQVPAFAAEVRHALRASGADVVYTNSAKAHVLVAPVARSLRLPCVVHIHDRIVPDSYGRLNRIALHAAVALSRTVIVNSRTTRASLLPGARARAEVVYCPVEVPALASRVGAGVVGAEPTGLLGDEVSFALVGRVSPWKGQLLAVEALAEASRVLAAGRGPLPSLHLYGAALFPRDQEYADRSRARALELGIADRVHWHGHVDDVPAAMRDHHAVLHASTRPEPLGQVILEAMANGVPVLAADAGGPRELLRHDHSGLLYALGDRDALAEGLCLMAGSPELRARLAEAAHARAQEFSYDRLLPAWESVLIRAAAG